MLMETRIQHQRAWRLLALGTGNLSGLDYPCERTILQPELLGN